MSVTDFGDRDQIIHIPARDLTGTRQAKLADLETFLAQLQVVRLALCGQAVRVDGVTGAASQRPRLRAWFRSWPGIPRAVLQAFTPGSAPPGKGRR